MAWDTQLGAVKFNDPWAELQQRRAQQQQEALRQQQLANEQATGQLHQQKYADNVEDLRREQVVHGVIRAGGTQADMLKRMQTEAPWAYPKFQEVVTKDQKEAAGVAETLAKANDAYLGLVAKHAIDVRDSNPELRASILTAKLDMLDQTLPFSKSYNDTVRARLKAGENVDDIVAGMVRMEPAQRNADATQRRTDSEIATDVVKRPGEAADAERKQRELAGTSPLGITAQQAATNAAAARGNAISQQNANTNSAREKRERDNDQQGDANPANIEPGSREYRMATDLASGAITYTQFLRMYPSRAGGAMARTKEGIYLKARDLNPEFTPAAFEAGYKFATNPKTVTAVAAVDNVLPNIHKVIELSNSWDRTQYPDINRWLGTAQFKIGDTRIANIRQAQKLIGDEIGNALGGGAMTDMKLQLGLDVVDPNLPADVFLSNMERVQEFLENRKKSLKDPQGVYGDATKSPTPQNAAPKKPATSAQDLLKKYGG